MVKKFNGKNLIKKFIVGKSVYSESSEIDMKYHENFVRLLCPVPDSPSMRLNSISLFLAVGCETPSNLAMSPVERYPFSLSFSARKSNGVGKFRGMSTPYCIAQCRRMMSICTPASWGHRRTAFCHIWPFISPSPFSHKLHPDAAEVSNWDGQLPPGCSHRD